MIQSQSIVRQLILFLILIVYSVNLRAINKTGIDSLNKLLIGNSDEGKVADISLSLALEYYRFDAVMTKKYIQRGLDIAIQNDLKSKIGKAYLILGLLKAEEQEFDSVIFFQQTALQNLDPQSDKFDIARCYNEIGIAEEYRGNYQTSIINYYKALKIYEDINDIRGIANEFNNIGLIYYFQKQYRKSFKYFQKAIEFSKLGNYDDGVANALNNFGISYFELKQYDKALDIYNQILYYDLKSANNKNIGSSYNNIGEVHYYLKQYSKSIEYLNLALRYKLESGDYAGLVSTYNNLGRTYEALNDFKKAGYYISQALLIAQKHHFRNLLPDCYKEFYELFKQTRVAAKALVYYEKYIALRDSIESEETNLLLSKSQSKYELEKAAGQILKSNADMEKEVQKKRIYILSSVFFLLTALVLMISIFSLRKLNFKLREQSDKISEQNNLLLFQNAELIKAREDAENAAKAKTQFLSVMSHEIRTPLNAIIGVSYLLNSEYPKPEQQENLGILKSSSEHLLRLINEVLDLNKIESGKMEVELVDFDLYQLISQVKELYTISAKSKELQLVLNLDHRIPSRLHGDPLRLNQVLSNLLSNAIKFTERGSVTIDIAELQTDAGDYKLEFRITDTGIGIEAGKQKEIFEAFTQAESSTTRRFGGSGLGLTICKKLLEMVGSELLVRSEPGKGSTFSFVLAFTYADHPVKLYPKTESERTKKLIGKSVLVVEDNLVNIMVLKQFLSRWKLIAEYAHNGLEAIEKVKRGKFDLILMDIQMPEMDGLDASLIIRNELGIKTPIIALTASFDDPIKDDIKNAGMNDLVVKPFNPDELSEKMSSFLT